MYLTVPVVYSTAAARDVIPTVVPGRVKTKEELIVERTQGN